MRKFLLTGLMFLFVILIGGCSLGISDSVNVPPSPSSIGTENDPEGDLFPPIPVLDDPITIEEPAIGSNPDDEQTTPEFRAAVEKYYDYFRNHPQIVALLDYPYSGKGFTDDQLAAFAIMSMDNYSYEHGNTRQEFDAITEKYFGTTIRSFNNGITEFIPGTDRIRAKGFSFNSSVYMVLKRLEENKDGSKNAEFHALNIPDSVFMDFTPPKSQEEIKRDLLHGNYSKYGNPFLVKLRFEEKVDEQGDFYLKYIDLEIMKWQGSEPATGSLDQSGDIAFDAGEPMTDEELIFAGGVRTGMSYEEVLAILGGYDETFDNAPGVKSIIKDGIHYGFYQIDETFTSQPDLESDGVYRLLGLNISEFSRQAIARGIKVGDPIDEVLAKFPGRDKSLRKWAHQRVYGQSRIDPPYAYLEFTMYDECYHLVVITEKHVMRVNFDRENRVRFIEVNREIMGNAPVK